MSIEQPAKTRFKDKIWIRNAFIVMLADIAVLYFSYFIALFIRFDCSFSKIPTQYLDGYYWVMPLTCVLTVVVFYCLKLYHSIWDFVSLEEVCVMAKAYAILIVCYTASYYLIHLNMPRSYYAFGIFISFFLHICVRFSYRLLRFLSHSRLRGPGKTLDTQDRIMIIGGGSAGSMLIREMKSNPKLNQKPVCVIDDNKFKDGRDLYGVPIIGGRDMIQYAVSEYAIDTILFAIPSASLQERKALIELCKDTGCKLRTLPGIYQLATGDVSVSKVRDVDLLDLLGRDQIRIDNDEVFGMIKDKTILVTGVGSIGSELCRQIASHHPKKLIMFDIYENNAYEIQQELLRKYPGELDLVTLIGSVRNTHRITTVMEEYKPDIVFHAAAHKHVPLMETSPNEAIKNNVMGTYKTATAAAKAGVKKFVLISTDKAVNPTNIMGATKRICEMIIQMMDRTTDTTFVAVRFGNVLGSNGSVVPLFKKQIAEGGPVTVTHKDIIRFFMTIPEAVSLVLQASYYAKGGEIFVLDMGEPVRIDDMARSLIKLSGLKPDVDIKIVYTGLRPGEKLYEEKLMDEEGMEKTRNDLIFIGKPIEMDDEILKKQLEKLDQDSRMDLVDIRKNVAEIVPTYNIAKGDA